MLFANATASVLAVFGTVWTKSLGISRAKTNTIVTRNGIYAGNVGFVHRLDVLSGNQLAENSLKGSGYHEVRVAATMDSEMIMAGCNGYLFALDALTLRTVWSRSLDTLGGDVSVMVTYGGVYVGNSGNIWRFNLGGHLMNRADVATSRYEVNLAPSLNNQTLLVGVNGYAKSYGLMDFKFQWESSLRNSGFDVVNVLGGDRVVYAGSNGYVYRLDETTGRELNRNDLPDGGHHVVRMALDAEGSQLYVGTGGYAYGLDPNTLGEHYRTSLPNTGFTDVYVADGDLCAFFASSGRVFQLDISGNIVFTNTLSGLGFGDTTVVAGMGGHQLLVVGINSGVVAIALNDFPVSYGPWMSQLAPQIGQKALRLVSIPGSHDSGAYGLDIFSRFGNDDLFFVKFIQGLDIVKGLAKLIISRWSNSQTLDFAGQLDAGIRYFDLRLQKDRDFEFVHGLVGASANELFDHVNAFLARPGFDKEIILLDFNHIYRLSTAQHEEFVLLLNQKFGDKLVPESYGANVTLNTLWASPHRIIVFYHQTEIQTRFPFLWPPALIPSPWPNKNNILGLLGFLADELPWRGSTPWVLQGVTTPDGSNISRGLIPFTDYPDSLLQVGALTNEKLVPFLRGAGKSFSQPNINVVIADWINWDPSYIDTVVKSNLPLSSPSTGGLSNATVSVDSPPTFNLTIHSNIQAVRDSLAVVDASVLSPERVRDDNSTSTS